MDYKITDNKNNHTQEKLKELQALPLKRKIALTQARIIEWYNYWNGNVYVSFSGGKDSTVLLDIARKVFPDIKAVFCDTGLEYPELKQFVKTFDNIEIIRPEISFKQVIIKYGYPVISKQVSNFANLARKNIADGKETFRTKVFKAEIKQKDGSDSIYNYQKYAYLLNSDFMVSDKCCNVMKKKPLHIYGKKTNSKPIIATMSTESLNRKYAWIKNGCNAFNSDKPKSAPMSFWTEHDVLKYIKENNLKIAEPYGEIVENLKTGKLETTGCNRTGCVFCMFGCHLEKEPNRFQQLKETHPKLYDYSIGGGTYIDGIWQPSNDGLGLGHVLDCINVKY